VRYLCFSTTILQEVRCSSPTPKTRPQLRVEQCGHRTSRGLPWTNHFYTSRRASRYGREIYWRRYRQHRERLWSGHPRTTSRLAPRSFALAIHNAREECTHTLMLGVSIHDHWSSIGHGNSPSINSAYYDVPLVTLNMLGPSCICASSRGYRAIFFHMSIRFGRITTPGEVSRRQSAH
jgi:hypothetical protein